MKTIVDVFTAHLQYPQISIWDIAQYWNLDIRFPSDADVLWEKTDEELRDIENINAVTAEQKAQRFSAMRILINRGCQKLTHASNEARWKTISQYPYPEVARLAHHLIVSDSKDTKELWRVLECVRSYSKECLHYAVERIFHLGSDNDFLRIERDVRFSEEVRVKAFERLIPFYEKQQKEWEAAEQEIDAVLQKGAYLYEMADFYVGARSTNKQFILETLLPKG